MAPIMNLMVVLIPLLLTSAQLIKISIIELNLPPAASQEVPLTEDETKQEEVKLELAVTITDNGFYVSAPSTMLGEDKGKLAIPKKDGEFDYDQLAQQLLAIKERASSQFPDADAITIQAEPQIDYQTLVSTMDAARAIEVNGQHVRLFPKASVSALML